MRSFRTLRVIAALADRGFTAIEVRWGERDGGHDTRGNRSATSGYYVRTAQWSREICLGASMREALAAIEAIRSPDAPRSTPLALR